MPFRRTVFILSISGLFFHQALADSDYQTGVTALKAGKTGEARTKLEQALKTNPTDPSVKLAYASVAPCSTALIIYGELSKSDKVPDSIRAQACMRLGDYSYASKNYTKAAEHYRNAAKIDNNPKIRHYWALAAAGAGDLDAALSLWHTLSLEYGDEVSQMAQYYMGLLHLKKGDYEVAYNCFLKSTAVDPKRSWTVASLAGKLECAARLGMADKVKTYQEQLKPYRGDLLEKDLLELSAVDPRITETPAVQSKPSDVKANTIQGLLQGSYTLQVGAFGSQENALNLQKKLSKQFSDISILPVTISDQVFYRVRIGTFSSKEKAESFAADSLIKSDLNYRVVEKKIRMKDEG